LGALYRDGPRKSRGSRHNLRQPVRLELSPVSLTAGNAATNAQRMLPPPGKYYGSVHTTHTFTDLDSAREEEDGE